VGTRLATVSGCVALAGGMGSLAVGAQLESLAIVIAGGFVLQGLGYGLLRPPVTTAVANALPQRDLGIGAASERLMGQIGVAFGITLLTVVYADTPTPGRFAAGFAVGAVLALLAAVAALAMHRLPGGRAGRGARTGGSTARTVDELAAEEAGAAVPAGAGEPVGGTGVAAGGAGGSAGGSTVGSVTLGEQGGPMGPSGSPPVPGPGRTAAGGRGSLLRRTRSGRGPASLDEPSHACRRPTPRPARRSSAGSRAGLDPGPRPA